MSEKNLSSYNWIKNNGSTYLKRLHDEDFKWVNQFKAEFSKKLKEKFDKKSKKYKLLILENVNLDDILHDQKTIQPTKETFEEFDYLNKNIGSILKEVNARDYKLAIVEQKIFKTVDFYKTQQVIKLTFTNWGIRLIISLEKNK